MKFLAATPHEDNPQEASRCLFVLEEGDEAFGQPGDVFDNLSEEVLSRESVEAVVRLLRSYADNLAGQASEG